MRELTKAEIDAFLAQPLIARIATVRRDGRPHIAPIWFVWDGETLCMETSPRFLKVKNLKHNPHCAISIDITEGGLRFKAVVLEGEAELLEDDQEFARQTAARIYTKYLGAEGILAPTPQRMINSPHVIIRLKPQRIISWDWTSSGVAPVP